MALQHLRSSTADKRPTPAAMSDGQLALNTNLVSPGLFFKDSNGDSVKIGPVHVGTTAPNATPGAGGQAGNSKGEAWLDTTAANPILKVFNGSAFVAVQPVGTGTVVSTTDTGTVTSTMILDGTILNADVNASAAIAGTKISPDFGSQTVTTTGVISSALGAAATPSITFTGDLNTGIYSPGADTLAFVEGGVEAMRITSAGLVGIGISSPDQKLHVYDSGDVRIKASSGSGNDVELYAAYGDVRALRWNKNGSAGAFRFQDDGAAAVRMLIDSSGNVGIGTASPTGNLHVKGSTLVLEPSSLALAHRLSFSTADLLIEADVGNSAASNIIFRNDASERARIDSSGRLGIGTSSPQVLLHGTTSVSSSTEYAGVGFFENSLNNVDTNPTTAFPVLKLTRAGKSGITFRSSASLGIARYEDVGAAARSRLDIALGHGVVPQPDTTVMSLLSSGAVGIGSTSPLEKFVVSNSGAEGIEVSPGTAADESTIQAYNRSNSTNNLLTLKGSEVRFRTIGVGTSEAARINSSGRLLIGTSSARDNFFGSASGQATQFQVEGTDYKNSGASFTTNNASLAGFGPHVIFARSRGASVGSNTIVQNGDTLGILGYLGNDGAKFVDAARISCEVDGTPGTNDMPARLVFSTTRVGGSSPTEAVRIKNTGYTSTFATTDGFRVSSAAAAGTISDLFGGAHSATAIDTGTISFRVTTNGNVTNTNNSYGAISDAKLKENIVDANSQWDDLKALQVRNYNFKEGQTHTQIGLVAQEAELVSPGLVSESPDRDGESNDLGTVTKSVNYSVLYMKAVKALQEAMERIEALEADVAQLKGA